MARAGIAGDGAGRGARNHALHPGRTGPGLTEDLEALADQMVEQGTPFYQVIPGLWYDRRRDEHSTVSRTNGDVWAPFYEMPWARTGKGRAADGLSLFDLSRFNSWYFGRLREFGLLAAERGLVLHYNLYNTHNLLEIPPHWVDYPWRPANNVNDTGLPEPPPIEPGNHIHVANQVYDVSSPVRRELHRALIVHTLEQVGDLRNVFLCLGFQFSGPLAFQEFFQDTVADWEKRTGKTARLELATSKDITDAILSNPARARQVAVIDMRYWEYRPDGSLLAPEGGESRVPGNVARRYAAGHDASAGAPAGAGVSRPLSGEGDRGLARRRGANSGADGRRGGGADAQSVGRPRAGAVGGSNAARWLCSGVPVAHADADAAARRCAGGCGSELVPGG